MPLPVISFSSKKMGILIQLVDELVLLVAGEKDAMVTTRV